MQRRAVTPGADDGRIPGFEPAAHRLDAKIASSSYSKTPPRAAQATWRRRVCADAASEAGTHLLEDLIARHRAITFERGRLRAQTEEQPSLSEAAGQRRDEDGLAFQRARAERLIVLVLEMHHCRAVVRRSQLRKVARRTNVHLGADAER